MLNGFSGQFIQIHVWLEQAKEQLEKQSWKIQYQSQEFTFDQTDYYASEMGTRLKRRFLSVSGIYSLESSADWKLRMVKIEKLVSDATARGE